MAFEDRQGITVQYRSAKVVNRVQTPLAAHSPRHTPMVALAPRRRPNANCCRAAAHGPAVPKTASDILSAMTQQLDGLVVIVTGSNRGIGKALAIGLGREGARVVVAGRATGTEAGALTIDNTVREVEADGGQAIAVRCDVTEPADVQAVVDAAMAKWGRIDCIINNAGVKGGAPFDEETLEHWQQTFRVNVEGPYLFAKAVLPQMKRQGSGSIITISSPRATSIDAGNEAYAASKAAIDRLMVKLAAGVKAHGSRSIRSTQGGQRWRARGPRPDGPRRTRRT